MNTGLLTLAHGHNDGVHGAGVIGQPVDDFAAQISTHRFGNEMIDPGRGEPVTGDAGFFNFKGQHQGGHGLGVIKIEDKITQTVGDEFAIVRFEPLQHVRVVVDQNICSKIDGRPAQLALTG